MGTRYGDSADLKRLTQRPRDTTVKLMSPKMVIPCHYNNDFMWIKKANPADDEMLKRKVEKMGLECTIMKYGDEIVV